MNLYLITLTNQLGSRLYLTIKTTSKKEAELYVKKNYPMYDIIKIEITNVRINYEER